MSSAATAAFCGVGAGGGGLVGTARALYRHGKALKNAVKLVCAASGTDNASAVFLGNGTANFKTLSAGIAGESVKRHRIFLRLLQGNIG